MTVWIRQLTCVLIIGAALGAKASSPPQIPPEATARSMAGEVVLITGSTDGLGREVARRVVADVVHQVADRGPH